MPKAKETITWTNDIDTNKLPSSVKKAYDAYVKARDAAKPLQRDFEQLAAKALAEGGSIPAGMEPLFAYRFGKLAVGFKAATVAKDVNRPTLVFKGK